jgi:hypothetical protein
MSKTTGTPVNTVVFDAFFSLVVGLLVFAGPQAINAVFAISVTALYIAYAIPIVARFTGKNDFKPGPFSLGVFVRIEFQNSLNLTHIIAESTLCNHLGVIHALLGHRYFWPLPKLCEMLTCSVAFLFPTSPQTDVQGMNYTIVVLGGVLLLSLFWYYAPVVGGVHWFKGPIANIVLAEADTDQDHESESGKAEKTEQ